MIHESVSQGSVPLALTVPARLHHLTASLLPSLLRRTLAELAVQELCRRRGAVSGAVAAVLLVAAVLVALPMDGCCLTLSFSS